MSTFYFMNDSVKNQVIWIIFGTQNVKLILHKWYAVYSSQLKNVTNNNNNDRLTAFDPGQPG